MLWPTYVGSFGLCSGWGPTPSNRKINLGKIIGGQIYFFFGFMQCFRQLDFIGDSLKTRRRFPL